MVCLLVNASRCSEEGGIQCLSFSGTDEELGKSRFPGDGKSGGGKVCLADVLL